jgi:hypothetical protein
MVLSEPEVVGPRAFTLVSDQHVVKVGIVAKDVVVVWDSVVVGVAAK